MNTMVYFVVCFAVGLVVGVLIAKEVHRIIKEK